MQPGVLLWFGYRIGLDEAVHQIIQGGAFSRPDEVSARMIGMGSCALPFPASRSGQSRFRALDGSGRMVAIHWERRSSAGARPPIRLIFAW